MTYLEGIDFIHDIESKYDVMSIKVNHISVWPMLRIKFLEHITGDDKIRKTFGTSAVKLVLKTLFYYNPIRFLKRYKVWVFSHNGCRNSIGDKRVERVTGCVGEVIPETLFIEKPNALQTSFPRSCIPEKNIVSESWILLFVHVIAFFIPINKILIENEQIILNILKNNNVKFDYRGNIRVMLAQKLIFDLILSVLHKPEKVIVECPYVVMGYVWSLHKHNIKVIEMQHGVLNKHHYAYNSKFHSDLLYPDELWLFGEEEYQYMKSSDCHYCKNVYKTGLYFLDYAKNYFEKDIFSAYRDKYKTIAIVAGQTGYEDAMAQFVEKIANDNPNDLFIYIPRKADIKLNFSVDNILFKPGVNIYEYMIWCDIHITISSTTCLECQYFHKPTIFYDYENRGSVYYSDVLSVENGVIYIDDYSKYKEALNKLKSNNIIYKEVFAQNTISVMKERLFAC